MWNIEWSECLHTSHEYGERQHKRAKHSKGENRNSIILMEKVAAYVLAKEDFS